VVELRRRSHQRRAAGERARRDADVSSDTVVEAGDRIVTVA